jgi:uncharacterized protein (DUF433 family)
MKKSAIADDPEIMGGTPVFRGTRVPVQTLIEHVEAGDSVADFLQGFPSVKESQVVSVLKERLPVPARTQGTKHLKRRRGLSA